MIDIKTQMELNRLDSHLNIMEREIVDFSETWNSDTVPQRIDDLRVILTSIRGIATDILEPFKTWG